MKPIGFGCLDLNGHDHHLIVTGERVADKGLLTLWLCRTHRTVGGFWHSFATRPDAMTRGGPLP